MTSLRLPVSAIIFDLGGVLVDLSVSRTLHAFSRLSGLHSDVIAEANQKYPEFFAYERGEAGDSEFRSMLRRIFSLQATDAELDQCWNAMLIGLPASKLKLVQTLKSRFKVFVLSNTNNIHIQYINTMFLNGESLDSHFHKCFYSHEVGMRKPESEIYTHVLEDADLKAEQTLFLDDNIENIKAASLLGIQTIHVERPESLFDLLANV